MATLLPFSCETTTAQCRPEGLKPTHSAAGSISPSSGMARPPGGSAGNNAASARLSTSAEETACHAAAELEAAQHEKTGP